MTENDKTILLKILDSYVNYLCSPDGKNSLIARIYGLLTIKTRYLSDVSILVMQNTA